jgi:predicted nucleic acid-binding protein
MLIYATTLAEILWVVNREDSKAAKKVQEYMYKLIDYEIIKVVPLDHIIIQNMLSLINRYNLTLVDSLIASTAMNLKAILVTRDKVFKKIKGIKVSIPEEFNQISNP